MCVLQVPGVLHGVARVDDDLGPLVGIGDQEDLLIQPEIPYVFSVSVWDGGGKEAGFLRDALTAVVRIGLGDGEGLVDSLP